MALRMSEEEYRELLERRKGQHMTTCCAPAKSSGVSLADEKPKRQKYGNKRVEVDGIKFDSQHEAMIYKELMLRKQAGEIMAVLRQVPFDLPGGIKYFADFCIIMPDHTIQVIDAKSEATRKNRVYINKKKQVKACWGLDIQEV